MITKNNIKAIILILALFLMGVGECVAESLEEWNTIYATWNSTNASVSTLPNAASKKAYVISSPRGTLFTNSTVADSYLLSNITKTTYHTNSSSADFQFLLYPTGNANGYYVYSVGLKKFVGSHEGQRVVMQDSPVEQFLYKHNWSYNGGTGLNTQPSFSSLDFPFSFSHVNNAVGQTIIVSNWSSGDNNIYGTRGGATGYDGGNVYKVVEAGDVSDEIYNEFLSHFAQQWTVNIKNQDGSSASPTYKVTYNNAEYADGATISAQTISAIDVSTTCTDKFVWGPIIDSENHTVTFAIRNVAENLAAGRWYQIEIIPGTSGNFASWGGVVADLTAKINERIKGAGHKSNYIYLQNTDVKSIANNYYVNFDGYTGNSLQSYVYLCEVGVNSNNYSLLIQHTNGKYLNSQAILIDSKPAISTMTHSLVKQSDNSFVWYKWGPWSLRADDDTPYLALGSYNDNTMRTFFHPVTTGEDYDIYKVMNTEAAVSCGSSSLVTTITNAGGTFFFVQKDAVLSASDFTINGEEPSAMATNENNGVIELTLTERAHELHEIATLAEITDMYGYYKLTADVNAPAQITEFHGHLDGNYHKITGLTHAIFNTVIGAKISNLILEDVNIDGGDIVGAIANTATGNSRIYNCGILATSAKTVEHDQPFTSTSTISGTTAGSIVGKIEGNARVVNCYSYADVNGTNAGGIVGDWAGTWYNGTTGMMVANCMYYGNLTGAYRSPIVYGGSDISNSYSIYSYFRWKSMSNTTFTRQNGALAATEDIWLDRFKFFQAGVTNHRDIAAYYVFGDASRISEMAQWYIDEAVAPWPILRKAEKQTTILTKAAQIISSSAADKEPNIGAIITDVKNDITKRYDKMPGTNGRLTVNININGSNYSKELPITDMDDKHYDYTWGKVVLPFANEFEGWTMPASSAVKCGKICVGWKVTAVTGGDAASVDDFNFADRDNANKDLYSVSNYIFAQGGNYIVPYGVTTINVEAHFADAYYLADATYDVNHGGSRPTTYNGKTVYTSVADVWTAMSDNTMPHDQAIVLVGNYHYSSSDSWKYTTKGCTIMSIDEDGDQQPDYGWYSNSTARQNWSAVRWDFITIPGFGMLQKGLDMPGLNIPTATGWFEITETCLCRTFEFEISDSKMTRTLAQAGNTNAYIIKGGWFQQLVRCYTETGTSVHDRLAYVNVGGNAYIKEFFHGNHSARQDTYTLRPINVTGGEIEQCFMTGMGSKNVIVQTDNNVRFYCAGGKIGKYLSVYNGYPVVDATMKVDHARIGRFFGGGTTQIAALKGNIDVTMNYSDVEFFCGGPEFGDMIDGKTVNVSTTGSTFGEFYGAGFGGTALTRITYGDGQKTPFSQIARLSYNGTAGGFGVSYEMEALVNYQGNSLFRYYDYRADLSMASTGNVTVNAENCFFKNNYFGGGCQGKVNGSITSTLTNCIVNGSVYGGGYKAAATQIDVYPTGGNTWPVWDATYKAFSEARYPDSVPFTWAQGSVGTHDESAKLLYTDVDMTQMGTVTGNTSLTIKGSESVVTGDVFGGGAESKVLGNSTVTIGEQPQP